MTRKFYYESPRQPKTNQKMLFESIFLEIFELI